MVDCLILDECIICSCDGDLYVSDGDILVNGILSFYVLIVHGQPTDSLPIGKNIFTLNFHRRKIVGN